jgi:hypothetical protein
MPARKLIFALVALVFGAFAISAQEKLPEFGDIADLKGMSRVYVGTDSTQSRKFILDELKRYKALEVVASPDDAQFILECKQTGHIIVPEILGTEKPTFEMTVYTLKDGRHRIAWSKTKNSLRYPPTLLTRDFLDALKKARGEKK